MCTKKKKNLEKHVRGMDVGPPQLGFSGSLRGGRVEFGINNEVCWVLITATLYTRNQKSTGAHKRALC